MFILPHSTHNYNIMLPHYAQHHIYFVSGFSLNVVIIPKERKKPHLPNSFGVNKTTKKNKVGAICTQNLRTKDDVMGIFK